MANAFADFIESFNSSIHQINPDKLYIEFYPKNYLQLLLNNSRYYLHIYAHVLQKILLSTPLSKQEIILIDYGAGNGLLGMFARHCGFKTVYLVDNSAIFMHAAKQLAAQLKIDIAGFITGNELDLKYHLTDNIKPIAIVGTDVIEHIYNLTRFFINLANFNAPLISVFTTASVTSNPIKNKQLMRLQNTDEHKYSNADHAQPGDAFAGQPFLEIRRQIIIQNFPQINKNDAQKLATVTRGMNKEDLLKTTKQFVETRALPQPLAHPTNTCDPLTGSWTEQLLPIEMYKNIYNNAGFNLTVYNGFYNQWQGGIKGWGLQLANKIIALPGGQGKLITPFITLVGKQN